MATPQDTQPAPEWIDDDPEVERTMEMDDDELEFDEFADEGEVAAEAAENPRDPVPLWRLIEMSQEDRSLKLELADFEDYDDYESYDGDRAREFSH